MDIEAARKAFAEYDVDGDGQITIQGKLLMKSQFYKKLLYLFFN